MWNARRPRRAFRSASLGHVGIDYPAHLPYLKAKFAGHRGVAAQPQEGRHDLLFPAPDRLETTACRQRHDGYLVAPEQLPNYVRADAQLVTDLAIAESLLVERHQARAGRIGGAVLSCPSGAPDWRRLPRRRAAVSSRPGATAGSWAVTYRGWRRLLVCDPLRPRCAAEAVPPLSADAPRWPSR